MNRRPLSIEELSRLGVGAYVPPVTLPDELPEPPAIDHGALQRGAALTFAFLAVLAIGVGIGLALP